MPTPRPVLILLLLLSAVLAACAPEAEPGPAAGEAEGPRVVALSPALGAIVRDLGRGEVVVGRHAWDRGFPESVPSVGDQSAIDYERLRRLEPTLVLTQWGDRALPDRLTTLAAAEGWAVQNIEMLSLAEIPAGVRAVGALLGAEREAAELVASFERACAPEPGAQRHAGRTLSVYGVSPLGVAGPGSFTHELIAALGAEPVPGEGAAFITMEPEDLRRVDPDTIVFFAPGADGSAQESMLAPLRRLRLRAVEEGRVIFITDEGALLPSTSVINAADELRAAILRLPEIESD